MLPKNLNDLEKFRYREASRAGYPGGMTMYGKGIVTKGNKEKVFEFFSSNNFKAPSSRNFEHDHRFICKKLSKKLLLNLKRKNLDKETVAAKFLDTFLYQLVKFQKYNKLWNKLHLIIDKRVIGKLKKYGDDELKKILAKYPASPYEASYNSYVILQNKIKEFIKRSKIPGIRSKIDLNFLWASP